MYHIKLKRQAAGQPIVARTLNQIMDLLEKVAGLKVSAPLAMMETASGPVIYLSGAFINIAWGATGGGFSAASVSGGVVTPASANIHLYDTTGSPGTGPTLTPQTSTTTVWNPYLNAIAGSKVCLCGQTGDGSWWIITADC